jgi:hypothetical protein
MAALSAVAYNVLHHLGTLPDGLGDAGGGTRVVDWLDLLTPYLVVGTALAALASAGTDRRGWWTALTGASLYFSGHGVHLAANSIGNVRGDGAPIPLWTRSSDTGSGTRGRRCWWSPWHGPSRCG